MDPTVWAALILVGGAVLLALAAVYAVRTAAKWPEILGRLTTVEVLAQSAYERATESLDAAEKARRIASSRKTKARRAAAGDPPDEVERPTGRIFTPGRGVDGRMKGGRIPSPPAGPHPVAFVDDDKAATG